MSKSNTSNTPAPAVVICLCGEHLKPTWKRCPECDRPMETISSRLLQAYAPTSLDEGLTLIAVMTATGVVLKVATDLSTGGILTAVAVAGSIDRISAGGRKDPHAATDAIVETACLVASPFKMAKDWLFSSKEDKSDKK